MTFRTFRERVRRIRELLKQTETSMWEVAKLCHEAIERDGVTLEELAEKVGRKPVTVKGWVRTWQEYGAKSSREAEASFSDHVELARRTPRGRDELKLRAASRGTSISGAARRGHRVEPRRPAYIDVAETPERKQRREQFNQELAEDPDYARLTRQHEITVMYGELNKARRLVGVALRIATENDLSAKDVDGALSRLDAVRHVVEWMQSYLEGGATDGFDKDLEKLLGGSA